MYVTYVNIYMMCECVYAFPFPFLCGKEIVTFYNSAEENISTIFCTEVFDTVIIIGAENSRARVHAHMRSVTKVNSKLIFL